MALTDPIFGPLLAGPDVEFAVLNTLEAWVPYMLRVLERRKGFPAGTLRDPREYRGGIDFETWDEDHLPAVIARVQPAGETDRTATGINQWYEIEIGVIFAAETEDESRVHASLIATTAWTALLQHGSLGGLAAQTAPVSAPVTEFPDPDVRLLVRARATIRAYITELVDDRAGTRTDTPPESPHVPDDHDEPSTGWPDRTEVNVTVTVED